MSSEHQALYARFQIYFKNRRSLGSAEINQLFKDAAAAGYAHCGSARMP